MERREQMNMGQKMKKLVTSLLLTVLLVISTNPAYLATPEFVDAASNLIVHYIDVGQGDATLLQYGGKNTLIDAGEEHKFDQLNSYLKKKNVKQIHNLVLTHPDADHCGGADYVMAKYKVKNIYMTTYQSKSNEYKEVLDAIKKYKVKRTNVKKGSTIDIGGIKAKVLSADVKADNPNDSSIVLKVVHNKKSFLFTGDIGAKVENQLVDKSDVNVDVLKVSHHGSDYSSAIRFIKATSPTYSVISVGKNNRYGHPVNTVLKRLEKYSKEILRTDRNGSIVITSTGTKLSYKTEKKTTNNSSTSSKPSGDSSSTAGISSLTNSSVVYITATGSKFHKKKCGSGTYKKTTYGKVKNTKLTPCKKCFG